MNQNTAVAVIGGGWAGIAAALTLADAGLPVHLFEAARQLGGRARSLEWNGLTIDNGPHLLLGAYRETMRLCERLGTQSLIERRPLQLRHPALKLSLPSLPAPLHLGWGLATASGLSLSEKTHAARLIQNLKRSDWQPGEAPLGAWLRAQGQPERLSERLWQPLALAALNTPIERASTRVFAAILRDSLGARRTASEALFTRAPLSEILASPALVHLEQRGAQIHLSCRVDAIQANAEGFYLAGPQLSVNRVVLATHPAQVSRLLPADARLDRLRDNLNTLRWEGILSLWLHFAAPVRLPYPLLGLGSGEAPWAFDRADIAPGVIAITASAVAHYDPETTLSDWLNRLTQQAGALPPLIKHRFIHEKRATFASQPGRRPPPQKTALEGLWLAGDYTHPEYPATLESAVASGVQCARQILRTS